MNEPKVFWANDLSQEVAQWAELVGRVAEERDNALAEVERLRAALAAVESSPEREGGE